MPCMNLFPLKQVPILFNLPEGQLQELAKRMQTLSVAAGEVIFKTGDPGGAQAFLPPQCHYSTASYLHTSFSRLFLTHTLHSNSQLCQKQP